MSSVVPRQKKQDVVELVLVCVAITPPGPLSALAYFPDGRRVVTGSRNGAVMIWNAGNGQAEGKLPLNDVFSLAVTRDGKIVCSSKEGNVKVWDIRSNEIVKKWAHPDSHPRISLSPDDRFVAVGSEIGWVFIHSIEGRQVKQAIEHGACVRSMSFSPTGNKLACGTPNGNILVYDVGAGTFVLPLWTGHKAGICSLLWSRDGSRLFSGSYDKTIRCWNVETGEQIGRPWTGHTAPILSLSLYPDGSILASGSSDKTIRFWNAASGDSLGRYEEDVWTICFSPSGEFISSATKEGKICFWRVPQFTTLDSPVSAHPLHCITRAHSLLFTFS